MNDLQKYYFNMQDKKKRKLKLKLNKLLLLLSFSLIGTVTCVHNASPKVETANEESTTKYKRYAPGEHLVVQTGRTLLTEEELKEILSQHPEYRLKSQHFLGKRNFGLNDYATTFTNEVAIWAPTKSSVFGTVYDREIHEENYLENLENEQKTNGLK